MAYELHPITPATPGYDALLDESMLESQRMLVRLRENWASGSNRFDRAGEILLGAIDDDGKALGVCGRNIDPYSDDPNAGRIRHLYVARAHRRHGIGAFLVQRMAKDAHVFFDCLNTRAPPQAFAFYERLGFARVEGAQAMTHRLILRADSQ